MLLAILLRPVPACSQSHEPSAVPAPADFSADATVLAAGDSVRIVVWRNPELSGEFVVATDGSLSHPLYRDVRVGGVSLATAEANVRELLQRFEAEPRFILEPLVRVAVLGEVNEPRVYAVRPGTSVGEAVAQAGGPTSFARSDRVHLLRTAGPAAGTEIVLDLSRMPQGTAETLVRSGDRILIERRRSFFRELLLPAVTVIGSLASIGIFIDRSTR